MVSYGFTDYLMQWIVVLQGLVIFSGNGLLLLTVLLDKSFRKRKEMLVIAGLAAADIIFGSGAGILAAYRILLMVFGLDQEPTTPWLCLITFIFLTHIGGELTAVMNVVVSIDRYIAVAFPGLYRSLDHCYAIKMLSCVGLYATVSMVTMFSSVYFEMDDITANSNVTLTRMCGGTVFPTWFLMFEQTFDLSVSLSGVIIYAGVYVAFRKGSNKIAPLALNEANHTSIQHRLTVTLGIITCSKFIFFVIPYAVFTTFAWLGVVPPYVIVWGTMSRISSIVNIVIYIYRQKEVRSVMFKIVTCGKFSVPHRQSQMLCSSH